jgi:predicted nucleic acid-binding protein
MKELAFLDTSIVLRHILGESHSYPHLERFASLYASELMRVEALRSIDRLRIQNNWPQEEVATRVRLLTAVNAAINFIPIQSPILRRAAEPFPTLVQTLDAIHIATSLLAQLQLNKPLLFLTHDKQQALAAQAAGLEAEGF